MLAADNFLPEGVTPEAAGRDLADMLPAAGLVADIVECAYVDVALIVERQRHQRIRNARVHECVGGRHAHHAVVQLILRPLDAVIVQETQGDTEGVRRLVSCARFR